MATAFVILTTPRSGSSWIASLCRSTGVMGHCREWLTSLVHPASPHRIAAPPIGSGQREAFLAALRASSGTPNGVYAVKVITSVWPDLPAALAQWGIGDGRGDGWMAELFPRPTILVLRRRDRIGQAISWWRAVRSGRFARFRHEDSGDAPPEYDFPALAAALDDIKRFERLLDDAERTAAAIPGSSVVEAIYEELLTDPLPLIRDLASRMESDLGEHFSVSTDLAVQRDESTVELRRRFERDLARAGAAVR